MRKISQEIAYSFKTSRIPEPGDILIANVLLKEEIFYRKVILLLEHNNEGSFGLILNKQTDIFLENILKFKSDKISAPLYQGGPVETNTLHFIHSALDNELASMNSKPISSNLYWGRDFELLPNLLAENKSSQFRFFLGYAGWASGQLNFELENNSWYVCDMEEDFIFNTDPEKMWEQCLMSLGHHYQILFTYPENLSYN